MPKKRAKKRTVKSSKKRAKKSSARKGGASLATLNARVTGVETILKKSGMVEQFGK